MDEGEFELAMFKKKAEMIELKMITAFNHSYDPAIDDKIRDAAKPGCFISGLAIVLTTAFSGIELIAHPGRQLFPEYDVGALADLMMLPGLFVLTFFLVIVFLLATTGVSTILLRNKINPGGLPFGISLVVCIVLKCVQYEVLTSVSYPIFCVVWLCPDSSLLRQLFTCQISPNR